MQSQHYMTMKEVNNFILKEILFRYSNTNYSYIISNDLMQISFTIDFNTYNYGNI